MLKIMKRTTREIVTEIVDVRGTGKIIEDSDEQIVVEMLDYKYIFTPPFFHMFPEGEDRERLIIEAAEKENIRGQLMFASQHDKSLQKGNPLKAYFEDTSPLFSDPSQKNKSTLTPRELALGCSPNGVYKKKRLFLSKKKQA